MRQYVTHKLKHLAEQRVRFRYSNGVEVVGTIIGTLPEEGEPYLIILEDVDIIGPDQDLLEQHNIYSIVSGSILSMDQYQPG